MLRTVSLNLPEDLIRELDREAARREPGESQARSRLVRTIVREYLARQGRTDMPAAK